MSAAVAGAPCQRCASALEADDLRCPICGLATPPPAHGAAEHEQARVVRCERLRGGAGVLGRGEGAAV
ncbi:hypothetical protein ACLESO_25265 [Pyxidicoccus sp. 3LG]